MFFSNNHAGLVNCVLSHSEMNSDSRAEKKKNPETPQDLCAACIPILTEAMCFQDLKKRILAVQKQGSAK